VTAILSAFVSAGLTAAGFVLTDVELSPAVDNLMRLLMRLALVLGAYGMIAGIIAWMRRPSGPWQRISLLVAVLYGIAFALVFTYHE